MDYSCDPVLWKRLKQMLTKDNIAGPKGTWTPKKAKLALQVYLELTGKRCKPVTGKARGVKAKRAPATNLRAPIQQKITIKVPMQARPQRQEKSKSTPKAPKAPNVQFRTPRNTGSTVAGRVGGRSGTGSRASIRTRATGTLNRTGGLSPIQEEASVNM